MREVNPTVFGKHELAGGNTGKRLVLSMAEKLGRYAEALVFYQSAGRTHQPSVV